jgi:hypothetical protein
MAPSKQLQAAGDLIEEIKTGTAGSLPQAPPFND